MPLKAFGKLSLLGKGSFGKVYKAKRRSDGTQYAIKEIDLSHMTSRERTDTVNEVRILASISHESIIRFCEVFLEGERRMNMYIVTELAHGDLGAMIERQKRKRKLIEESKVWSYFLQILQGMKALHDQNVMHRDLKPQNIFYTKDDKIKIGDLGCSKLLSSRNSLAKTQCGTPYYMSPEIYRRQPYNKKSDIWALGCILFEMMALNPPFLGTRIDQVANNVMYRAPPRFSKNSPYSKGLKTLVYKMLSKNPKNRPSIDQILALPITVERMGLMERTTRSIQRSSSFVLLNTIHVPKKLTNLSKMLPSQQYHSARTESKESLTVPDHKQSLSARSAGNSPVQSIQVKQRPLLAAPIPMVPSTNVKSDVMAILEEMEPVAKPRPVRNKRIGLPPRAKPANYGKKALVAKPPRRKALGNHNAYQKNVRANRQYEQVSVQVVINEKENGYGYRPKNFAAYRDVDENYSQQYMKKRNAQRRARDAERQRAAMRLLDNWR